MSIRNDWPETLTAQEVFDHAVEHMRTQEARCSMNGVCTYRGSRPGEACAAGALLTDEEARRIPTDQGSLSVDRLVDRGLLPARLLEHQSLLYALQVVHDSYYARPLEPNVEFDLKEVARRFAVTYTPPAAAVQP